MAYTSNVPQATQKISQTQPLIQDNFMAIATAFNLNHGNFDDPNQGKHEFLQMPEQSSAPATAVNEMGLYTKESSLTSQSEMFIRKENNGQEIEFTSFLGAANGWTRLPSGILLKWGQGSGTGNHSINFPTGATIPVFTSTYIGFVSVRDTSGTPNTFATFRSVNTTSLSVFGSSRTSTAATAVNYNYLVIGS